MLTASIIRLNTPILCEHNRHISPYNKKETFFEEIRRDCLRMCIFCSTFVAENEHFVIIK
jgi:radical SAM superfamily enzyme YgiQ (UPF0313 family)